MAIKPPDSFDSRKAISYHACSKWIESQLSMKSPKKSFLEPQEVIHALSKSELPLSMSELMEVCGMINRPGLAAILRQLISEGLIYMLPGETPRFSISDSLSIAPNTLEISKHNDQSSKTTTANIPALSKKYRNRRNSKKPRPLDNEAFELEKNRRDTETVLHAIRDASDPISMNGIVDTVCIPGVSAISSSVHDLLRTGLVVSSGGEPPLFQISDEARASARSSNSLLSNRAIKEAGLAVSHNDILNVIGLHNGAMTLSQIRKAAGCVDTERLLSILNNLVSTSELLKIESDTTRYIVYKKGYSFNPDDIVVNLKIAPSLEANISKAAQIYNMVEHAFAVIQSVRAPIPHESLLKLSGLKSKKQLRLILQYLSNDCRIGMTGPNYELVFSITPDATPHAFIETPMLGHEDVIDGKKAHILRKEVVTGLIQSMDGPTSILELSLSSGLMCCKLNYIMNYLLSDKHIIEIEGETPKYKAASNGLFDFRDLAHSIISHKEKMAQLFGRRVLY